MHPSVRGNRPSTEGFASASPASFFGSRSTLQVSFCSRDATGLNSAHANAIWPLIVRETIGQLWRLAEGGLQHMRKEANAVEDGGYQCSANELHRHLRAARSTMRPIGRAGELVRQKHGAIFDGHASITG
jgi:hypothetical protein